MAAKEYYESLSEKPQFTKFTNLGMGAHFAEIFRFAEGYAMDCVNEIINTEFFKDAKRSPVELFIRSCALGESFSKQFEVLNVLRVENLNLRLENEKLKAENEGLANSVRDGSSISDVMEKEKKEAFGWIIDNYDDGGVRIYQIFESYLGSPIVPLGEMLGACKVLKEHRPNKRLFYDVMILIENIVEHHDSPIFDGNTVGKVKEWIARTTRKHTT